jgi:hypothetical protein
MEDDMKSTKLRIVDRESAFEAIKGLTEKELIFLNRVIVERLKLISQVKHTSLMAEFSVGDRVSFQDNEGETVEGRIIRINKKTVSLMTDEGSQWKVSPGLLTLLGHGNPDLFD